MCAGCDVPMCGGLCGTVPPTAPRERGEALALVQRRTLRLRRARGAARWWSGGWRPVEVRAWWPAMDKPVELPF